MTIFLIIFGISALVMASIFAFYHLVLKSMAAGFQQRYPLDFLFCVSKELTVLRQLGWTETGCSGSENPIVHLTKDGNKAELMLKSSEKQSDYDVLLTINESTISLRGISDLTETISSLESSTLRV